MSHTVKYPGAKSKLKSIGMKINGKEVDIDKLRLEKLSQDDNSEDLSENADEEDSIRGDRTPRE